MPRLCFVFVIIAPHYIAYIGVNFDGAVSRRLAALGAQSGNVGAGGQCWCWCQKACPLCRHVSVTHLWEVVLGKLLLLQHGYALQCVRAGLLADNLPEFLS